MVCQQSIDLADQPVLLVQPIRVVIFIHTEIICKITTMYQRQLLL